MVLFILLKRFFLLLTSFFLFTTAFARELDDTTTDKVAHTVIKILIEQPNTIEHWTQNRIYLDPSRVTVTRQGVFTCTSDSILEIPSFAIDDYGLYLLCSSSEVIEAAQQHYDNALQSMVEFLKHAAQAGGSIVIPPLAIYEGYNAVQALKNAATEYVKGLQEDGKIIEGIPSEYLPKQEFSNIPPTNQPQFNAPPINLPPIRGMQ